MKAEDLHAVLEANGWRVVGENETHLTYKHPQKPGRLSLPKTGYLVTASLRGIERFTGLRFK